MIQINGNYYQESDIKKISAICPILAGYNFEIVISTPYESDEYKREVFSSGKDFVSKSMLETTRNSILAQLSVARQSNRDKEEAEMEKRKLGALRNINR